MNANQGLSVFVADFDGTVYVKCNKLQRAMFGYNQGQNDILVSLTDFTERLNNEQAPE